MDLTRVRVFIGEGNGNHSNTIAWKNPIVSPIEVKVLRLSYAEEYLTVPARPSLLARRKQQCTGNEQEAEVL